MVKAGEGRERAGIQGKKSIRGQKAEDVLGRFSSSMVLVTSFTDHEKIPKEGTSRPNAIGEVIYFTKE